MPLIAVSAMKPRPGVTTVALGLAAVLPTSVRPVVVECDPTGGDLAARFGLRVAPGLVELAAATPQFGAARFGAAQFGAAQFGAARTDAVLSRFAQRVQVGDREVEVVCAPSGSAQTRVALSALGRPGHSALTGTDRAVIVDCGRLDVATRVRPPLEMADAVVLLVHGRPDDLAQLCEHVGELVRKVTGRLVVTLVAGGVYGAADVEQMLHRHLVGVAGLPTDSVQVRELLPYDESAAAILGGQPAQGRGHWRGLPLMTALSQLAADLSIVTPVTDEPAVGNAEAV